MMTEIKRDIMLSAIIHSIIFYEKLRQDVSGGFDCNLQKAIIEEYDKTIRELNRLYSDLISTKHKTNMIEIRD